MEIGLLFLNPQFGQSEIDCGYLCSYVEYNHDTEKRFKVNLK